MFTEALKIDVVDVIIFAFSSGLMVFIVTRYYHALCCQMVENAEQQSIWHTAKVLELISDLRKENESLKYDIEQLIRARKVLEYDNVRNS